MTELEGQLTEILKEKTEKLIPENIRKGITIFGITGTLEEKTDTEEVGGEV